MRPIVPEVNETHDRLTITEVVGQRPTGAGDAMRWIVNCVCSCGKTVDTVVYANLRSGNTKSCGCLKRERIKAANTKHGATIPGADPKLSALWQTWASMSQRCREQHPHYVGVSVCEEWSTFPPFRDWAFAHGFEVGLTIDRIDWAGNYEPDNCRWANSSEQARNRRSNKLVLAWGEIKCIADWVDDPRCVVNQAVLGSRIRSGWAPEDAMSAYVGKLPLLLTHDGETKRLSAWAKDPRCRVNRAALVTRIKRGWSTDRAITTPPLRQDA